MMISTSRNSIYSHTENDKIDFSDRRKDTGSLSSVSSPNDITAFKSMDNSRRRRSSASSSYSIPKFSHSLNNGNRYSGSPGSNLVHSLSSNIASRKASIDNVSLAIADTSAVYADFEKPKSNLIKNNNTSLQQIPFNDSNNGNTKQDNTEITDKNNDHDDGRKFQHSSYNDEDDLLFFMGDSN